MSKDEKENENMATSMMKPLIIGGIFSASNNNAPGNIAPVNQTCTESSSPRKTLFHDPKDHPLSHKHTKQLQ